MQVDAPPPPKGRNDVTCQQRPPIRVDGRARGLGKRQIKCESRAAGTICRGEGFDIWRRSDQARNAQSVGRLAERGLIRAWVSRAWTRFPSSNRSHRGTVLGLSYALSGTDTTYW
eukprot:2470171-Rhodomonas_salina.3